MTKASEQFAAEIDAEWADTEEGIKKAIIFLGTEGLAGLQEKSPVDVGTFRANWLVSVGDTSGEVTSDLAGFVATNASTFASYGEVENYPVINLQNNLPYAWRIENGWSNQAPNGVVSLTVAELAAMAENLERFL